jgi:hypothetical protein
VREEKVSSLPACLHTVAAEIDNLSCEMRFNIMTGYPHITYERLNATAALTHSLTWLRCLAAAISKLDPYHVVSRAERKRIQISVVTSVEC